jgi:hypothetical protein
MMIVYFIAGRRVTWEVLYFKNLQINNVGVIAEGVWAHPVSFLLDF